MKIPKILKILATASVLALSVTLPAYAQEKFQVTLLGTGTPLPDPDAFGPATLVQIGARNFLFDAGRGVTIRLAQKKVRIGGIDAVFLTHMHSDHINGLGDILLTGWLPYPGGQRKAPLEVYGPDGVNDLAEGLQIAFKADEEIRSSTQRLDPSALAINAHKFADDGVVYEQDGAVITAIRVVHGPLKEAYGFRIDFDGRSVVISGDTAYSENLIKNSANVDLLIHEVFAANDEVANTPQGKGIATLHVSPEVAGEVFLKIKPKLAAFTHVALLPPKPPTRDEVLARAKAIYDGPLVMGHDGMTFDITTDGVTIMK